MARQRVVLAALGGVMLAAIVGALVLVMAEPTEPIADVDDTPAGVENAVERPATAPEKRRHAGHEGSAAIFGRLVRGKDRTPVAGETVELSREGVRGWSVTSADDGTFRFERLPHGGPFELSATVADCAPVRLPGLAVDRREELDVGDLRLDRAVSVTVEVRSMDDSPIEGALVEAYAQTTIDWSGDWTKRLAQIAVQPVAVATLRTDAKGEAQFSALAAGTWAFRASAEGHARGGRAGRKLEPKEEDDDEPKPIVIRLWPGYGLQGRVTDQDDRPLPGAVVLAMKPNHAWSPQMAPLHHRTVADADGHYALSAMVEGEFAIWAGRPDGVPAQIAVLRVPELSTFDVRLRLGGTLQGTVTEAESGEPVADVEVRATGWVTNSQRIGIAVTDPEGHYVIDTMLEGIVQQVTVDRPGWLVVNDKATPWQQIALNAGTVVEHDLTIRRGAVLTGVVNGPDGSLANATITLYASNQGGWTTHTAKTGADGRYRIEGLPQGDGMIQARAEGHAQLDFPAEYWEAMNNKTVPEEWAVEIPASGEVTKDVTLVRGGHASGSVKNAAGEPIAGAKVSTWAGGSRSNAETDDEGRFSLSGLALGNPINVSASAEGFATSSQQITVAPGTPTENIEIVLQRRSVVRGVLSAQDGSALRVARVQIRQPRAPDSNGWNWQDPERAWDAVEATPVAADGTYEIELPFGQGKFVVRASAEGFAPADSEPQVVEPGREAYELNIELGPATALRGRVLDAVTGAPVPGAYVALGTRHPMMDTQPWMTQNVIPPLRATTDAEGRFVAPYPREGKLDLRVTKDGYVESKPKASLPQDGELEVRLAPALRIAGVVKLADGTPVSGVQISHSGATQQQMYGTQQTVVTGDDGRFTIRDLAAGTYTVTAQPPWNGDVNIQEKALSSVAAGTEDVELVVLPGKSITGRVTGPDGEGVANTWINARRESDQSGSWRGATTRPDGTFDIVGLSEGTFTLHVNGANGAQTTQVKGVAAGTRDLAVRLAEGMEISGQLVDEEGQGVSGESLYAALLSEDGSTGGGQSAQTGTDGSFTIRGLAPGDYILQRMQQGGGDASRRNHVLEGGGRVTAGSTGVRLVLTAGAVISGVVVDASGATVAGSKKMWVKAGVVGAQAVAWTGVNEDGTFEIAGLSPDVEYELRTMGGGFRPSSAGPLRGGTSGVRIVVETGLTCSGALVDSRGDPIPGATMTITNPATQDYVWGQTDDSGNFEIAGLDEGEHDATAWIQNVDAEGNRSGQQRQVKLGNVTAGTTGLRLEVPDAE